MTMPTPPVAVASGTMIDQDAPGGTHLLERWLISVGAEVLADTGTVLRVMP